MNKLSGCTYGMVACGDADFLKAVVVPFGNVMREFLPSHAGERPESLQVRQSVQNSFFTSALIGITIFVGGHFAKKAFDKVFDDVYAIIIQPRLEPLLEKIDLKLPKTRVSKKSFNISLWYQEANALVSITVVGETFADIHKQLDLVPTVHAGAISWIAANGCSKPVLHYKIEDRKVNVAPILADNFEELHR